MARRDVDFSQLSRAVALHVDRCPSLTKLPKSVTVLSMSTKLPLSEVIAARCSTELVVKLDELVELLTAASPIPVKLSRSDVARAALDAGVDTLLVSSGSQGHLTRRRSCQNIPSTILVESSDRRVISSR